MKRLFTLLLMVLFCIGVSACDAPKEPVPVDDISITSMLNVQTGTVISLGMSQEEAEALLGEGTYLDQEAFLQQFRKDSLPLYEDPVLIVNDLEVFSYGTGKDFIVISYDNNIVDSVGTAHVYADVEPGPSNWCIKYGLTFGSTKETMFQRYGEKETLLIGSDQDGKKIAMFEYYYDASGNPMDAYLDSTYMIIVGVDEESGSILSVSTLDATPESALSPSDSNAELK